ncbi:MAG TPA: acyl-CoA dehydrogenase [Acidimicrobiaceae bacterium]|nr:acyl-CoA dehydrogenase [Acidimicrobiaceae bacterium]
MDLTYPPEADVFREKVRAFLAANLPAGWKGIGALAPEEADEFRKEWRNTLYENGYLAVNWPKEYGGAGLTPLESVVMAEEFARAGAPTGGANDGFGIAMLGNTLLRVGTEEQKRHYLPRILSGEDLWCQGYSEPAAGSDLGNLGCRAVLDGDEWVINGQKIWTSAGHLANHIFVLARTAPDEVKHRGITFLLVDMRQPGVEVRPIKMMGGDSEFNEVFFTDARCPKGNVVGEVNGGWMVAMTLLGNERGAGAAVTGISFRNELDKLMALAKERGVTSDPVMRDRLAKAHTKVELMRFAGYRALTSFLQGRQPGPDASIGKLFWSEYHREVTELAVDILGADAMTPTADGPMNVFGADVVGTPNSSGNWTGVFYNARAGTIYAGTSQVQKGIVGEQILGLPKEPRADAGPWNQIPGHG